MIASDAAADGMATRQDQSTHHWWSTGCRQADLHGAQRAPTCSADTTASAPGTAPSRPTGTIATRERAAHPAAGWLSGYELPRAGRDPGAGKAIGR